MVFLLAFELSFGCFFGFFRCCCAVRLLILHEHLDLS